MAAPSNTAATSAVVIASLPYDITQTVDDAGTTYTVWYAYTPSAGETQLGLFGFGDLTTYTPRTRVYTGPAASPVAYLIDTNTFTLNNRCCTFPVTPGTTYYFEFVPNAGNPSPAELTLNVQAFTADTYSAGSILVNDDSTGFPLAILSPTTDHDVLAYVPDFVAGDEGDTLNNGLIAAANADDDTVATYFSPTVQLGSLSLPSPEGAPAIRACHGTDHIWVANFGLPCVAQAINNQGEWTGTPHTITTGGSVNRIAASNDETILYFCQAVPVTPLERWDLTNDQALSDLSAGFASYRISDILVLDDDTIVACYYNTLNGDVKVRRFNAAGSVLNTYEFGANTVTAVPRLAYAIEAGSFWIWRHLSTAGLSRFARIQVSDGSVLGDVDYVDFRAGVYAAAATDTPTARFGVPYSCPFFILRESVSGFTVETEVRPIRRLRQTPHVSANGNRLFHNRLQLDMRVGVGLPNGQGSDPKVMLQVSRDGGMTWGVERFASAGAIGQYLKRVQFYRQGVGRDVVYRIVVSDPVAWQIVGAYLELEEGLN